MRKIKVMSVIGTRPEAIKMAAVIAKLEQEQAIQSVVVVTAQHRELLDQVLDIFAIAAAYDLNIMSAEQTLTEVTVKILAKLEKVIAQEQPDLIIVHGDTTTTFSTALAAFYQQCPVAHIEAGLRSGDKYAPYPEEVNRKLTGSLADLHFAPTKLNYNNLIKENIAGPSVFITGNTVIDTLLQTVNKKYQFKNKVVAQLPVAKYRIIVVTVHRRENIGQPLVNICLAIKEIIEKYPDLIVIIPIHPNPKIRKIVASNLSESKRIYLLEPLGYQDFVNLLALSYLILTDSGGLQEEAPALDKPVLVLRDNTERKAGLEQGTIKLVGTETSIITAKVEELLNSPRLYQELAHKKNPYGDGLASRRIVDYLLYYFNLCSEKPEEFKFEQRY
ncbi:MAG: non-hydrolyzing UDP-N-acetylglucosamine 2-epimerase [Bacillota bacterium]